jgi:tetratricopeptide (TPR) repeat protein
MSTQSLSTPKPPKSSKPQKHPNNIRKVIKQSGLKFYEVAEQTDIPRETLVDYCAGKYPIPHERLQALSQVLGVPPEYLVPPLPNVRASYESRSQHEETKDLEALLLLRIHCQQHPTDENALQQLMELLGKVGRYTEIEKWYEKFVEAVKKEDIWRKPDVDTAALLTRLRAQSAHSAPELSPAKGEQAAATNEKTAKDQSDLHTSPAEPIPSPKPNPQTPVRNGDTVVIQTSQVQIFVKPYPDETPSRRKSPSVLITSPSFLDPMTPMRDCFLVTQEETSQLDTPLSESQSAANAVNTSLQQEENLSPSGVQNQDIIDLEGGPMKKDRRNLTTALAGIPIVLPGIGQSDLLTDVQRVLHLPRLCPGEKDLEDLEQKMRGYWLARNNVTLAPTDLLLDIGAYVRDVKALLDRSLSPSIRTRLCACLSQGILLIGVISYDAGQFQTARGYYQTAIDAAHEANHNILQALAWVWDSYSWMRGNEEDRYEHARYSVSKARHFAFLESDLAVQCNALEASAEVHAYLKEKEACIEALESLARLASGSVRGDWWYIHQFDLSKLNGVRGICLQQFYQQGASATDPLLEEAMQALKDALSQPNVLALRQAFHVVDMAQVHARKGEVEPACDCAKQIITIANTKAPIRQRLWIVRTLLEPYADVADVKNLDREIRVVLLQGQ